MSGWRSRGRTKTKDILRGLPRIQLLTVHCYKFPCYPKNVDSVSVDMGVGWGSLIFISNEMMPVETCQTQAIKKSATLVEAIIMTVICLKREAGRS
jgi:hypothetical protein